MTTPVIHRGTCAYLVSWDCGKTWQSCDTVLVDQSCGEAARNLLIRDNHVVEITAKNGARFQRRKPNTGKKT